MKNAISRVLDLLVAFYQRFLSPLKPPSCRFYPTCSDYFRQAVAAKGPVRGTLAGIRRILRCHPLARGGFDPVEGCDGRDEIDPAAGASEASAQECRPAVGPPARGRAARTPSAHVER